MWNKSLCVLFIAVMLSVILPPAYARLTDSEQKELASLQALVDANSRMSEEQMERWEQLLLKDPEKLQKLRQRSIDKWKDSLRNQGVEFDERDIDRKAESQWQDFLESKNSKMIQLNEKNVVILLRKIKEACFLEKQNNKEYPISLNELLANNPSIIDPRLYKEINQAYTFRYEKLPESYRVFAFPRNPSVNGQKIFLLDEGEIFFTKDGSVPTSMSHRLL